MQFLKDDYDLIPALSGEKALKIVEKLKVDLILLDIAMPEMDGYELCKILKSKNSTKSIPIIFITAKSDKQSIDRAYEVGAINYITKPFYKEEVLSKLYSHSQLEYNTIIGDFNMGEKYDILIVDDESQFIQILLNILKQIKSYNLIVATSGKQALKLVKQYDFNLILLDIIMQPMDGYEVCKILKNDSATEHIPIIFLTAKDDQKSIEKGFKLGSVDYITKPFYENELLARVNTHIKLKLYEDKLLQKIKIQENLLAQQSKMATMGEVLESIAHQWKQPLSVIAITSMNVLADIELDDLDTKLLREGMQDNMLQVKTLSDTLGDFKSFLKQDRVKKAFSLKNTLHAAISIIVSRLKSLNIEVIEDTQEFWILGFKNQLIHSVINILHNAIDELEKVKYERLIFIDAYKENDSAIIKIKDNAGGIPEKVLNNIFDSHFTTKEDRGGTGVGLYMTQKIITTSFKGTIKAQTVNYIHNEIEHRGALFTIKLPLLNSVIL